MHSVLSEDVAAVIELQGVYQRGPLFIPGPPPHLGQAGSAQVH